MARRMRRRGVVLLGTVLAAGVAAAAAWAAGFALVPSPNPGESNSIDGLVAFSPTEVWAIGNASSHSYQGCHGRTLTARWDGSAFTEVPTSPTPVCGSINGVAGTSTSDIWTVGSTNEGRDTSLRHWDGNVWTIVPGAFIPPPGPGRAHRSTGLNGVAALSPSNVWAVGRAEFEDFSRHTLIEHWNGNAWKLVDGPTSPSTRLNGIAALRASNIWAVGVNGQDTLTVHWDGTTWTVVPSPNANVQNTLTGVAAVATNDVWAVGSAIKDPYDGYSVSKTLIEHWDGTAWTIVKSPNVGQGNNALLAIAARSAHEIFAVGYYDDVTGEIPIRTTLVLHWNGRRWSRVASANRGTGDNWLTAVVAPAGTTDAWASGASAGGTLVERFTR